MATERKEIKQHKPLPAPNSDFYEFAADLPAEELAIVKKVREYMETKVQPIIDQTNPQIQAIRREADQKIRALVNNAVTQIRPILTPEQQKTLDESRQQRGGGRRGALKGHGSPAQQADQEEVDQ